MDDAVLDFRFGIDRLDRRRKTGQIIRTGNENILDALADAGLIFPQHLGVKFALAIPRHRYRYIAKTGAQGFAAVPVPAVIRVLVLAAYIRQLQQLTNFSRRVFSSGGSFPSCHCDYLRHPASILHLVGGLHKVWDGVPNLIDDQLKYFLYHYAKLNNRRLVILDRDFMLKLLDWYIEKKNL